MRFTRFLDADGQTHDGLDRGDGTAEILRRSPIHHPIDSTGRAVPVVTRLAPLRPVNIFCIGLNYRQHALETGAAIPEHPVVFMKPTSTVADPGERITIPACCTRGDEVDYEAELAVVIGKTGRDIPRERALDYVLGYTCADDISARKWQKQGGGGQWIRGKSFDTFCPLGPVLVTRDEIPDPQALTLSTTINGERLQNSTTADMIYAVAELIAFLSQDTTLLAGTVILTGTPPGVGMAREPRRFLQPGDEVTVEIEGIGKLTNPVAAAEL